MRGNILENIEHHKRLIDVAVLNRADVVVFPELSLTGYEPTLAARLATEQSDSRFDGFQTISDSGQITIGVGVPTKSRAGICISLVLFRPHKNRHTYSKQYLHRDEEPFFVTGQPSPALEIAGIGIAPAICYEISVDEHSQRAFESGARIYIASVAKTAKGAEEAIRRLAHIAHRYAMTVLMSNCVGESEDGECVGKSSIWNAQGLLVAQLNDENEGVLLIDTETQELVERTWSASPGSSA